MINSDAKNIKIAQKEAILLKEFSQLFLQICLDEPKLNSLHVTKVKLSRDKGSLTIFFSSSGEEEDYNEKRRLLVLYKPSLRSALASKVAGRYTPKLRFKYDQQFEKQKKLEDLLNSIKTY